MEFLIFATLGFCSLALLYSFRRQQAALASQRSVPTSPPVPRRIANPRRAARPDVGVWVLRAASSCDLTQSLLDGRRYSTEDAPALPGVGCSLDSCRCCYEPLSDTRRSEQRRPRERRGDIRFQSQSERRLGNDRRQTNSWQHAPIY